MKKRVKHEEVSEVQPQGEPSQDEQSHGEQDVAGALNKIQQQLAFLEKKIDTLIGNSSARQAEARPFHRPFQSSGHTHGQGQGRQDNDYRERTLHKAVCADCKKECQVPFRPTGDRPVYCKDCFGKRKAGDSFKEKSYDRDRGARPEKEFHAYKPHGGEKKKPYIRRRKSKK
jgi:CxxC-x17-CxxC domain-containing protein